MVMLRSGLLALTMAASIAAVDAIREAPSSLDVDLARRAYMAVAEGQPASAVEIYSQAIRRHPDSYMPYYRRGVTYGRMGRHEHALADLNKAVALSPQVKTSNELGVRAWNSLLPETHALNLVVLVRAARADVLRELDRLPEAVADLDAAIALDPRRTSLWHQRGLLHMETGNADAAIADFSALLSRRENVEWRFARGLSHLAAGNLAEAEADFIKVTTSDPKNALAARWLAKTRQKRGIPV